MRMLVTVKQTTVKSYEKDGQQIPYESEQEVVFEIPSREKWEDIEMLCSLVCDYCKSATVDVKVYPTEDDVIREAE